MQESKNSNIGKLILAGGLLFGGWWLWNRRNLNNQILVGAPKSPRISGGKLLLTLPVTNISDVDITFNGFLGNMISYYNNANGVTIGSAVINTPAGGIKIKAKTDTELEVTISVSILSAGSTLFGIITSGDWDEANCYLVGNYYITSSNLEMPYKEKIV